jgi:hypothetical protein
MDEDLITTVIGLDEAESLAHKKHRHLSGRHGFSKPRLRLSPSPSSLAARVPRLRRRRSISYVSCCSLFLFITAVYLFSLRSMKYIMDL